MKKKLIIFFVIIIGIFTIGVGGCSKSDKKGLTDFKDYSNLNLNDVTNVHVKCNEKNQYVYEEYDITDKSDVERIATWLDRDDAFVRVRNYGPNTYYRAMTLYNGEILLAEIPLGHINDGSKTYEASEILINHIIDCGKKMDYFKGFRSIDRICGKDINFYDIVKVEAYLQNSESNIVDIQKTFEITDNPTVSRLIEILQYRKAFLEMEDIWESNDLSYIKLYDSVGNSGAVMLNYGKYKLLADEAYTLITDYGVTNGYLQN